MSFYSMMGKNAWPLHFNSFFSPYLAVSMYNVSSNSSAILKQHVDKVKYSKLFDKHVLTYSHDNNMYCDLSITWLIIIHVSTCTYRDVNLEWFRLIIFILQPKKNLSFKYWFYFGHLPLFNIHKFLKFSYGEGCMNLNLIT